MKQNKFNNFIQLLLRSATIAIVTAVTFVGSSVVIPQAAHAYPFWAQETAPETPREATGRIVCANCHLGKKEAEIEIPQAVTPNSVFEAVVKIPYDLDSKQVLGDGSLGGLNVGAVLMLPDGFKIAPDDRIPEEMKAKMDGVYYQSYKEGDDNVIIVGPLPGEQYQEVVFPILAPDPGQDKSINFGKYSVHLGANRGRGQVYPTGEATNNNPVKASADGVVAAIAPTNAGVEVTLTTAAGETVETIPAPLEAVVSVGDTVAKGALLSNDPNVGGFGQKDTEIVLQNPARIVGLMIFVFGVMFTQIMLVLKKKQVERVQAAEGLI
jgi:apocytochrome f